MKKCLFILLSLLSTSPLYATVHIYEEPNINSTIMADVDPEHTLDMRSSDWIQVKDTNSGVEGWAKLSELKNELHTNGQWEFSFRSDQESPQMIHYKPVSSEETLNRIANIHKSHDRIMQEFEHLWSSLK